MENKGLEWLAKGSHLCSEPEDAKRKLVVDKFFTSLKTGIEEHPEEEMPLKEEAVVRRFAVALEQELEKLFSEKPREYKARVFTLNFNLSDRKNTSLRRRILQGQFAPAELALATSEQLASDDLQERRKEQLDRYYSTQVLKRKEELVTEPVKKTKTATPEITPVEEAQEVAVPDFSLPPVSHPVTSEPLSVELDEEHLSVDEEPAQPEQETESAPAVESDAQRTQTRASGAPTDAAAKLRVYGDHLKSIVANMTSESLKTSSCAFLDYLMRHISS
jgi:hypothetical protein